MSIYTCQLRDICESYLELDSHAGYKDVKRIAQSSAPYIFSQAKNAFYGNTMYALLYPQFKKQFFESWSIEDSTIAEKVIMHFYMREISGESVGRWLTWINKRVFRIAPIYEAWFSNFGTFYGFDFDKYYDSFFRDLNSNEYFQDYFNKGGTETIQKSERGEVSNGIDYDATVNGSDSTNRNSHTADNAYPQSNIASGGYNGYKDGTHKRNSTDSNTNTNIITHDEVITGGDNASSKESYEYGHSKGRSHRELKSGSSEPYGKMIERYKKATVNVHDRIIHEFDDLFLNLY